MYLFLLTCFFFSLEPDTTLATTRLKGKKKDKERLTVAFCANADGTDKMKPFVIGKYLNPRCFKNINCNSLGIIYEANKKAWMTAVLFQQWLKAFDIKMTGRKTILLLDNAPSHIVGNLNLRNTTIHFLPPNTTSYIQPMDAGIIMSFKCHYRNHFVKWLLEQYESEAENKNMDILSAIRFIVRAWREVSLETIYNCFRHTRILPDIQNNNEEHIITVTNNNDDLIKELDKDIEALHFRNKMDIEKYINYPEEENTEEVLNDQEILNLVTYLEPEKTENEEEEDDSTELQKITHKEALNAIELTEQYFVQQDLSDTIRLEYDTALLKLRRLIGKFQSASFKQTNIETFLEQRESLL
jgi:DDE superfamily endonuclease